MKFSAETKDGAIDNLLRAYVSRPSNPLNCTDFDPDQANAYVERALTDGARSRYEQHLSGCPACRKSVVALMRLANTVAPTSEPGVREAVAGSWLDSARRMLGAFARPQWAMAAAAVIVAAISLPLILSRDQATQPNNAVQVVSETAPSAPAAGDVNTTPKAGEAPAALVATAKQQNASVENPEALAKNSPASRVSQEAAGLAASVDLAKKAETKSTSEPLDETQRKSDAPVAAAPPQAAAQGTRSDFDQNRQQQQSKDAVAQQSTESKAAARVDDERAKEKTERAEEVAQPPAPRAPAEDARGRSNLRRRGSLALRDSEADAVRPEERKFSGKKFLFKDGAWTDKDFDPNKDLPSVTIIRDSNVYLEVLKQRPGLKPFLTGFPATQRAIIVYKGTVYKLIPQ